MDLGHFPHVVERMSYMPRMKINLRIVRPEIREDVAAMRELLEDLGRMDCAGFVYVPWEIHDVKNYRGDLHREDTSAVHRQPCPGQGGLLGGGVLEDDLRTFYIKNRMHQGTNM